MFAGYRKTCWHLPMSQMSFGLDWSHLVSMESWKCSAGEGDPTLAVEHTQITIWEAKFNHIPGKILRKMLSCKDILHKGKKQILTFICWIWARKAFTSPEASSFTTACSPGPWKLDLAKDFDYQLCKCWCHPRTKNKQYPQKTYEAHRIADEFCPLRKFQSAQCLQWIAARPKTLSDAMSKQHKHSWITELESWYSA